jgi:hypothetical protein
MLGDLERHIAAILATTRRATLATKGPAGLLFNAEVEPCVVVSSERWHLRRPVRVARQTAPLGPCFCRCSRRALARRRRNPAAPGGRRATPVLGPRRNLRP